MMEPLGGAGGRGFGSGNCDGSSVFHQIQLQRLNVFLPCASASVCADFAKSASSISFFTSGLTVE